jgi:hypothetical protein
VPVEIQWSAKPQTDSSLFHTILSIHLPVSQQPIPAGFLTQPPTPLPPTHILPPTSSHPPPPLPLLLPTQCFRTNSPEVSAACCLTAALSRLKALSAGPSRPEAQRRAATLRKTGSAVEARVAVRRPNIVLFCVAYESGKLCGWSSFGEVACCCFQVGYQAGVPQANLMG